MQPLLTSHSSLLRLILVTAFVAGLLAGFWILFNFSERMWSESLSSRAVDRRFLRWQSNFLGGRRLLGHWRGRSRTEFLGLVTFTTRIVVLGFALLWLYVIWLWIRAHAA